MTKTIELSSEQQRAAQAIRSWICNPGGKQVFKLFGYAGTGKTTIARSCVPDDMVVSFAAFTGKAATVLARKGCEPASTIHSLMYVPVVQSDELLQGLLDDRAIARDPARVAELDAEIAQERERLADMKFELREEPPIMSYDLVVVDEASMVDQNLAEDLLSFGIPILALGDPGQLPPVKGKSAFMGRPDFQLGEIHRQAKDSPVLTLATMARTGKQIPHGTYGDSKVLSRSQMSVTALSRYDQVLCGTNRTRLELNRKIRTKLGFTGHYPNPGEKLICLKNDKDARVMNGSMWKVRECEKNGDVLHLKLCSDDNDTVRTFTAPAHDFDGRANEKPIHLEKKHQSFFYGYAITTHKAQGSQWDRVCVVDESRCFRQDAEKWLYTAVTRAAKSVTILTT
jgi:exodeoxyribonuclease-5